MVRCRGEKMVAPHTYCMPITPLQIGSMFGRVKIALAAYETVRKLSGRVRNCRPSNEDRKVGSQDVLQEWRNWADRSTFG